MVSAILTLLELNIINEEETQKAKKDPRYVKFMKWVTDNGARFPRVSGLF